MRERKGPQTTRAVAMVGMTVLLLVAGLLLGGAAAPKSSSRQTPSATKQPGECAECHEEQYSTLRHHRVLDTLGWASMADAGSSCNACHGDGAEHIKSEGEVAIFTFDDSHGAREKSESCQTCHADSHPRFRHSAHARAGLDCTTCHAVHSEKSEPRAAPRALAGRASATCSDCHASVLSEFTFTEHHRLEEGVLECTSCHNPHEPQSRVALGGFKDQQCVGCHTDKGGPFVFEHGSLRIEGCTSCHSPHGSPNRHMLTFQSVAEQCYSCHAFVPGFHTRFTMDSQCTSCHSSIHGSNLDPAFLR